MHLLPANCLLGRLLGKSDRTFLYLYHVDGTPREARTLLATDYKTKIISCVPLIKNASVGFESTSITVNSYVADNRDAAPTQVKLWLEMVAKHSLDGLLRYINGEDQQFNSTAVAEAMNIIIAKAVADPADPQFAQNTFQGKNNRFYFRPGWDELSNSAGIIATRGYYSSVRPAIGAVLLNVNLVYGAYHRPVSLEQYITWARGSREPEAGILKNVEEHLAGLRVWVDFERANRGDNDQGIDDAARRTKTLRELGRISKQQLMTINTNEQTTVWDHLSKKYGGSEGAPKPDDAKFYTGNVGESVKRNNGANSRYYLARQLKVLADQPYRGTLGPEMTQKMIELARKKPDKVQNAIMGEGLESLKIAGGFKSPISKKLDITVNPLMVTLDAHKLPTPEVKYGSTGGLNTTRGFFDVSDHHSVKFSSTSKDFSDAASATIQFFRPRPNAGQSQDLSLTCVDNFLASSAASAVQTLTLFHKDPTLKCITIDDDDFKEDALKILLSNPGNVEGKTRRPDLVAFLSNQDDETSRKRYSTFKIVVDQLLGMKSICLNEQKVQAQVFEGRDKDYFFSLSMKLNLRCGNDNHRLVTPLLAPAYSKPCDTLILGADVTHPSGSDIHGTPSIAALVGSVGKFFARFSGSMRLNPSRQEIIDRMQSMAEERIEEWYMRNESRMPARILFYRNGVDEAQFSQVLKAEVKAIRDAHHAVRAKKKSSALKARITAIIVTKRHQTRLFPTTATGTTKNSNCRVGTLVDSGIASPYIMDFFLLSHNVLAGTGRPAHYYVLLNEMILSTTELQKTTFELCFTYGRSTTSVSYAPPA
jgi:eukaryotic translation initiation factor 2C